ncbi:MAG: hypothetical protein GWP10_21765 [Nitrospiraceae bacterium]|nr:hypothetical protein [Nitrospiraceae bacterium]
MAEPELKYEVLSHRQMELYQKLKRQEWLHSFYLAGGTALALQIGHRKSLDFDFFFQGDFENRVILEKLAKIGRFEPLSEAENTLHGVLHGVNISFLGYSYPILEPFILDGDIRIANIVDIACMKLSAIASRSDKKDFIDIYYLLKQFSLVRLFQLYQKKCRIENYEYMLLKSLVYFKDADSDPMPIMLTPVNWEQVKQFLMDRVRMFHLSEN